MLNFSEKETRAMGLLSQKLYLSKILVHISQIYPPDDYSTWGYSTQEGLNQKIVRGIKKAKAYGFVTEVEQFDYLVVMMELGENFDNDAKFPWAGAILNDRQNKNRGLRLSTAYKLQLVIGYS